MTTYTIPRDTLENTVVDLDVNMTRWIEFAPVMMHSIDVNGRLIAVSDVWLRALGYARDDVIGRPSTDFMTAESRDYAIHEVLPEFFRRGRVENINYQMVHKSGRIIDVLVSATLARGAQQQRGSSLAVIVDVTEMKDAERRRVESESLYRGLVEDQSECVALVAPSGELRYVNQAYAAPFGRKPDEMMGRNLFELVPPESRTAMEAHFQAVRAVSHSVEFESQMVSPSGESRWIAWSNRALVDSAGNVTAIHCVGRDIQRRVAAEQRVVESETRYRLYRTMAENSNDMKLLVQDDGRPIFVSPACHVILGYEPDEMLRLTPFELVHPDDLAAFRENIAQALGRREALAHRMQHKDGRYVWVESHFRAIPADAPQARLLLIVIHDIERRIVAERQLRESEARFRLLAENTSDTIVFWPSADDRISYVSPAIRSLLGYEPDEFAGFALGDYVHPEDLPERLASHASLSLDNRRVTNAHRARDRNGDWIWVEIALAFVGGAANGVLGIIGALRDVTERQRQAEALQKARDAAETAGRIKADFLANMSHELRTPLAGILGIHNILQADGGLNDRQERLVKLAEQSGRMLLNVVNDILDYSKMEAGQLVLKSERFSAADLIGSSVSIISGLAAAKQLDVQVASDETITPHFIGDEDRLRQILLNFLNNAVKFTSTGRVALKVERLGASEGAERLRFSVTDTGIGIPHDKIDRLFQRFSQVDSSSSREYGGSGLGLAIVRRLVELMHGDVGVESTPGEGSTFWFTVTLPVARDEETPRKAAAADEPAVRAAHLARILVAEDIEVNQVIIRGMLESAGHEVDMVANGADAVLAASTHAYDIVLMDIQMPGVDGVAATRRIRALPGAAARLPIVAMTADVLAPKVAQFLAAGMDGHVGKPFSREQLLAVVARHVAGAVGSEQVRAVRPPDAPRNAAVDESAIERLVKIIGQPKVESLIGKLAEQLKGRFVGDVETAEGLTRLATEAHKLASSAGMLGFVELSRRCAALEATLNARQDAQAPLAEAREACAQALAEISRRLVARPRAAAAG